MKKIEFLKQGMENFCNHIEPIELDFTNGTITMITGPNGIGKTSMFQAIPYTFYGVCEKGRGEDVLNDKIKKNCHTWNEFKVDEVKYRVDRYVKYTRVGNLATITRGDDTKPYLKGHTEVVKEIEKLLMPYKIFMNTVLFSQKVKSFFTDLGDAEQKEIFRKIMGLDDYVLYGQTCNTELKELTSQLNQLTEDIAVSRGVIESTEKQRIGFLEKKKLFEETRRSTITQLMREIVDLNNEILMQIDKKKDLPQDTTKETAEINRSLEVVRYKLDNIDTVTQNKIDTIDNQAELKLSELETDFLQRSAQTLSDKTENQKLENEKSMEETTRLQGLIDITNTRIQELDVKRAGIASDIKNLQTAIDNIVKNDNQPECPTCLRPIDEDCIKHFTTFVDDYEGRISFLQDGIMDIVKEVEGYEAQKLSLTVLVDQEREKLRSTIRMYEGAYRDDIAVLTERKTSAVNKVGSMIEEMKTKIRDETKIESHKLSTEITEKESKLEELEATQKIIDNFNEEFQLLVNRKELKDASLKETEESEYDMALINECDKSIKELQVKIERILKDRVELDDKMKMVDFWKTGFSSSGIQSMLIDEAIPFMNSQISYYMSLIAGGRYSVTFDTLKATKSAKEFRDKISVNVFDNQTHSDKRVKFSGGQTRIVDVGTILTLADLQANIQNTSVNIILFDEIFDSLDGENIRYVSNLLRLIGKEKWVGVISHNKIEDIEADVSLEFR